MSTGKSEVEYSDEEKVSLPNSDHDKAKKQEILDIHADFGGASSLPPPPDLTLDQQRRLYRKIDYRLMPMLTLMYLASSLDRSKLSYPYVIQYSRLTISDNIGKSGN